MYPVYFLEVYDHVQYKWIKTAYDESNRPHHYDFLRTHYERLVSSAKMGSLNQKPIGYRIMRRYPRQEAQVVDLWTNGKVEPGR